MSICAWGSGVPRDDENSRRGLTTLTCRASLRQSALDPSHLPSQPFQAQSQPQRSRSPMLLFKIAYHEGVFSVLPFTRWCNVDWKDILQIMWSLVFQLWANEELLVSLSALGAAMLTMLPSWWVLIRIIICFLACILSINSNTVFR